MNASFPQIGGKAAGIGGENSFWPSFTDVMMVITMIFLMATSVLVVRNWHLVAELRESIEAERLAAQVIESTTQENATLEERLANAEQANSILRLRLMRRGEELQQVQEELRDKQAAIGALERDTDQLRLALDYADARLDEALQEIADTDARLGEALQRIETADARIEQMAQDNTGLEQQLAALRLEQEQTRDRLAAAREQVGELTEQTAEQRQAIRQLTAERESLSQQSARLTEERDTLSQQNLLLAEEVEAYNQQLLTLKGDYETVRSKYEELIKPARSALGKYIAEVYYVKGRNGNVIRFRTPEDQTLSDMTLAQVEQRLEKLKAEHGKDLYIKIIIPEDSGLSYNEAWEFMRNLLVKYDYYYQE